MSSTMDRLLDAQRQPLSIRTAKRSRHSPTPSMNQDHSSIPRPNYPIAIPPEKLKKALELYKRYQLEIQLALEPQSATTNHDGYHHLHVPGLSPRSTTSHESSRRRALSVTTSCYDAVTDLSSVVSFDDNESTTSAMAKAQGEWMSFDGKKVKQRTRKRLSPTKRAKAALVRHLGACRVCGARRVPCPLEHHDIQTLENLRLQSNAGPNVRRPRVSVDARSSNSSSSQRTTTSLPTEEQKPSAAQNNALAGIGAREDLAGDYKYDTVLDIASPGGLFGDMQAEVPAPATLNHVAPNLPDFDPNPYTSYQNGQMVALGVLENGWFCCQHLDGLCSDKFITSEELQVHFELMHFSFNRIDPAERCLCTNCWSVTAALDGPCHQCAREGMVQLWIYGQYIRIPSFQHFPPTGGDITNFDSSSAPFNGSSFPFTSMDSQWGSGSEMNPGSFTGNGNQGNFSFHGANYGGPSSQGYGYDPAGGSDAGSQYQGNTYEFSLDVKPLGMKSFCMKTSQFQRQSLLLTFLSGIVFLSLAHTSLPDMAKILLSTTDINAYLPKLYFLIIVGSFLANLSVKQHFAKRYAHVSKDVSRNSPSSVLLMEIGRSRYTSSPSHHKTTPLSYDFMTMKHDSRLLVAF